MDGPVMKVNGARIDELSQQILIALYDASSPQTVADLKSTLGEKRQRVWYRVHEHLSSAGLVSRIDNPERTMIREGPFWKLSVSGQMFVKDNHDELARPKSLDMMSKDVYEACQTAKSAKDSVQGYRQKLYRLKKEQQETEVVLNHLTSKETITRNEMVTFVNDKVSNAVKSNSAEASRVESRLDELEAKFEELTEGIQAVNAHVQRKADHDDVKELGQKLERVCHLYQEIEDGLNDIQNRSMFNRLRIF
ncbi:hypothetical protein [Natronosalvus caseinilyticus]|uniref:hypothetical protein n=1 Tax=Natronosalvus caseinilyticus TaxID=2953747 RepID=UPI0028A6827A|nr:hypothetical protein [Natronosalvus caseinilyticus]